MPAGEGPDVHPEVRELSAYLDGVLSAADRAGIEAHLAGCVACRNEVAAVAQLLRTVPPRRPMAVPVGLAAAAVLALLLVPALDLPTRVSPDRNREPAVTMTAPPLAIGPQGSVDSVSALVWSAVPRATRYRLILLDDGGTAVWRFETTDTVALVPDSVRLEAGASYFWKVEAETGFGRWVASDLVDFTTRVPRR